MESDGQRNGCIHDATSMFCPIRQEKNLFYAPFYAPQIALYGHHVAKLEVSDDTKKICWKPTMVPLKDFDKKSQNKLLKEYCKCNGLQYQSLLPFMHA